MEIKIGMWCRYKREGVVMIGKITHIVSGLPHIDHVATKDDEIIKIADNPWDLLEIGDIVHYDRPDYIDKKEIEEITKTNIKLTKNFIKLGVRQPPFAIELHENRVIQRI